VRVCVVGTGYVGLVTAACLAELGHEVTGVEINRERLEAIQAGIIPIHEPGLEEVVHRNAALGRLRFTADIAEAQPCEVAMIAVNTPSSDDGRLNVQYVHTAVRELAEVAAPGTIIVIKSTVPVGTCDDVASIAGGFDVVSNPEFLREGSAVNDFMRPDRVIVGGEDAHAIDVVAGLYISLGIEVERVARRAAELGKYAANSYLATRLSFMNELAALCDAADVDVAQVEQILGSDHRIGPHFLKTGIGWGGSCLPKDVLGLLWSARAYGADMTVLQSAQESNQRQRSVVVERVLATLQRPQQSSVAVLGLAFKAHTDDVRQSPALDVVRMLRAAGVHVRAFDPLAIENARREVDGIEYCHDAYEAVRGVDAIVIATEWPEFRELNWQLIAGRVRGWGLIDARNLLDGPTMRSMGFQYQSIGRNVTAAPLLREAAILAGDG
jgi:UDPglucose 6-dehydrogenase